MVNANILLAFYLMFNGQFNQSELYRLVRVQISNHKWRCPLLTHAHCDNERAQWIPPYSPPVLVVMNGALLMVSTQVFFCFLPHHNSICDSDFSRSLWFPPRDL